MSVTRQPRSVGEIPSEYLSERAPAAVATTTAQAEAQLLERVRKRLKRNRLWSLGTEPEQLELEGVTEPEGGS
jgi:hypothetical protein